MVIVNTDTDIVDANKSLMVLIFLRKRLTNFI